MECLLRLDKLKMYFPIRRGMFSRRVSWLKAVDDVSFCLKAGESLGLVGESGCGKSTVARCIMRLYQPTSGSMELMGQEIGQGSPRSLRAMRPRIQMVFQDPAESLNARMTLGAILEEPLIIHGIRHRAELDARVATLLDQVGLAQSIRHRYPHELSGGQRQRICIARALALKPKILILDEPVSALDISIQAQVINLLLELQRELGLSYLFISHDLSLVRHVADRTAVMYQGKIVEMASSARLYTNPRHAYTRSLLTAIPSLTPGERSHFIPLPGEVPSPIDPPSCSAFGRRINHPYLDVTYGMNLAPREIEPDHWVAPDPCALSLSDLMKLGIDIYQ